MYSRDLMDFNNDRAEVVKGLINYCLEHGLDYSYTEKHFSVKLPFIEPTANEVEINKIVNGRRKHFDITKWGPTGPVEGEEHDPEEPLTEGETPEPQL